MLQPKTRWKVADPAPEAAGHLARELGISNLVAQLLINRGLDTSERARRFLHMNDQNFYDPFLMKGMRATVDRIRNAVKQEEKILVFGDYDADGVTSTSILTSVLKEIGAKTDYYIPNRFTEGYGPNEPALHKAKEEGYSLVVTVDTGISAVEEAEAARGLGLDFIITDHHQPPPVLPNAYCIVNPHQEGCLYPFKGLSGAGVAFKLAHALLGKVPEHLLDYAVIGTIADLVPLVEENRLIAVRGLIALKRSDKPGIRALLDVAGIDGRTLSSEDVGFGLGPRLNAAGRLGSAVPAVQLLLSADSSTAEQMATNLDLTNRERKQLVNDIAAEAIEEIDDCFPPDENSVLVIAKEG
ncbi:MAG TPA: DHH family phosphoesterase, partial [Bacillales bacterium]|nr:DHH family phosphoesterase [Bacillales bacterium]